MKFTVDNRKALLSHLTAVAKLSTTRSVVATNWGTDTAAPSRTLRCVVADGTVELGGSNTETTCTVRFPASGASDGHALLPTRTFQRALGVAEGNQVTVTCDDTGVVTVSDGTIEVRFDADDTRRLSPVVEPDGTWVELDLPAFCAAVDRTAPFALTGDLNQKRVTGVNFVCDRDDGQVQVVATDQHRLGAVPLDAPGLCEALPKGDGDDDEHRGVLVPAAALKHLLTLATVKAQRTVTGSMLRACFDREQHLAAFEVADVEGTGPTGFTLRVTARLVDARFPTWRKLFDNCQPQVVVECEASALSECLTGITKRPWITKDSTLLFTPHKQHVNLHLVDRRTNKTSTVEKVTSVLLEGNLSEWRDDSNDPSAPRSLLFTPGYLKDAVEVFHNGQPAGSDAAQRVRIGFSQSDRPVIFTPAEADDGNLGDGLLHLVMPKRTS